MTRRAHFLFTLLCLSLTTVGSLTAQESDADANVSIPHLIRFGGVLKAADGTPTQGTIGVTFAFYKDAQGGTPLWMETQNVTPDATGRYSVMLGATKSDGLPAQLFISKEARWLSVEAQGLPARARVLLLSVPYALKAADAETIGGLPPSAFVLAPPTTVPSPSAAASSTNTPPPASGVTTSGGTVNIIPLWSTTTDIENSAVSQTGSGSTAKIGINTTTPASTLDVKGGATIRGTLSLPATGVATATGGKNSQPANLAASSFNSSNSAAVTQTFQFKAEPAGNNTAAPSGTLNVLYGAGTSAPAETGLKIASNGQITFATGQTFPGTGNGTITGVTAGGDLTGGGSSGNVTLNLDTTKVVTGILAGTDLTGGGTGGVQTLNLDTSKIPQLSAANTFTSSQTVSGNLTATGVVSGSSYQIGSNLFAFGSFTNGNAYVGFAGNTNATNVGNTAMGYTALSQDTVGCCNTANGWQALTENTTGGGNIAVGWSSLVSNTTGSNNTAIGYAALDDNDVGSYNTAVGVAAGPGTGNFGLTNATAIGARAEVDASNALVLGSINGVNHATADTLVGIGTTTPAAKLDVHGTANFTGLITFAAGQTFPGTGTITGVTAGTDLIGGGTSGNVTLNVDTTKVVTGITAGTDLTGGGVGGVQTLGLDTTKVPQLNSANAFTASQTVTGNLTASGAITGGTLSATSSFNLGSSVFAFGSVTNSNVYLGFAGTSSGNPGTNNTGVGSSALLLNTGSQNTALGTAALLTNSTGSRNTGVGYSAINGSVTTDNTAIGWNALSGNFNGIDNYAGGSQALDGNFQGSYNTGVGMLTLHWNGNGNYNSALGYKAGTDIASSALTNTTAIGALADVTQSNSMVLGAINGVNGSTVDTNVGIGTTAPAFKLHVGTGNNDFRVEGPPQFTLNPVMASFGGAGDFAIDAPGIYGGRFIVKDGGVSNLIRVGIGTAFPDSVLSVNGSADKPGGGSWGTFSDGRLKNIRGDFSAGLSQILKLHPVRYQYKKENALGIHDSDEHVGFVAQDVQKVIPEAVTQNNKGYLMVNNDPILWTMLNAIKEQQRQISILRAQLRRQAAKNSVMESRLAQIEHVRGSVAKPQLALCCMQGQTASKPNGR